jgi:predicted small lipoprotein YifL
MRRALLALIGLVALAACGERPPNEFPQSAHERFNMSCPPESAACVCTWDKIIRTVTYQEYEAALARFRETGLMDPRITRAKTQCLERHRE